MTQNKQPKGFKEWIVRWGPAIVWMGALFYFSSLTCRPPTPGLERFQWDDKLQHAGAYAILATLIWRAMPKSKPRWWIIAITLVICSIYGASDELHQKFVPGRECALSDWIFDTLGATAATVVISLLPRSRRKG